MNAGDGEDRASELRAATVHGLRWTAIARPAVEIILLGSMVVLARLIPPAEFGRYAVVLLVQEIALVLGAEGVGTALVQREDATRRHLQSGFALCLITGVTLTAVTLALSLTVVGPLFGEPTAEIVRLSAPGCFLASLLPVPMAVLRRRLDFKRLSMIDLSSTMVRAGASIALAIIGLNAEALVLGGLASIGFTGVAYIIRARPPLPLLHRKEAREIMSYGVPASLAGLSFVGFRNCDYIIVGARLGAAQAGLYFRAYQLAVEYQKKISLVMSQVGFPVLSRAGSAEERDALRFRMVRILTLTLFPLLVLLAVLAPVLVPWAFGDAWDGAIVPTQILALGGASTLVIDAIGTMLMAQGRPKALLGYGVGHFVTYAGAVVAMTPFGLVGVAVAAAVVHTVFLYVAYVLLVAGEERRALPTMWHDVGPATVASAVLGAAIIPLSALADRAGMPAFVHLVLVGIVGIGVYALALRTLHRESWNQLCALVGRVVPTERLPRLGRRPLTPAPADPRA